MEIGYIYKITNKINQKIYIGQTSKTLEQRWREHKYDCKKGKTYPLYRAFRKYGINNFEMELIEKCKTEELNSRESYWINFYDTYRNGYNATLGGEGVRTFNISDQEIIDSYNKLDQLIK